MLENFGLAVATFCMLFGSFLLYDGISDANQVTKIIGGAVLLSGGLMGAFLITKSKIVFWRTHGRYRER
jgi:hypothetical protein